MHIEENLRDSNNRKMGARLTYSNSKIVDKLVGYS